MIRRFWSWLIAAQAPAYIQPWDAVRAERAAEAERIAPGHPYWSASYDDVCRAVDREMQHRAAAEQATPAGLDRAIAVVEQLPEPLYRCAVLAALRAARDTEKM